MRENPGEIGIVKYILVAIQRQGKGVSMDTGNKQCFIFSPSEVM
jgi:hypothetical protein